MYLYKTMLYKNTDNAFGVDEAQNTSDRNDFENNRKASAQNISSITIAETTYEIRVDYSSFSSKVSDWSAVKYSEYGSYYVLYLDSATAL